ncbi:MAG: hypothetical protein K2M34_04065 [Alphaproteobacteria bacterium]|nr:hypothetical protein [Alphaproteobacteria bacterium]
MKPKLITALTVPVLLATGVVASADELPIYIECGSRGTCDYDKNTYRARYISSQGQTSSTNQSDCMSGNDCWVSSYSICLNPDMGRDGYHDDCTKNCKDYGYEVAVLGGSLGAYNMGCACKSFTQWQTYKTGVLREYVRDATSSAPCTVKATNNFKCATDYYGTPDSNGNGCIPCDGAGMYCNGDKVFGCVDGWYKNAAKNGCVECPNSKAGNLGYDSNGNGIKSSGGGDAITDCYFSNDTVLYDDTGTFTIVDNDCYYKQ